MDQNDKIKNKARETSGKVKEGLGDATGDDKLRAEGKKDQAASTMKRATEKIRGAFKK